MDKFVLQTLKGAVLNSILRYLLLIPVILIASGCTSAIRFSSEPTAGMAKAAVSGANAASAAAVSENSARSNEISTQEELKYDDDYSFKRGLASYYSNVFNGRRTASGESYDNNELTAAHRNLPFGTKVLVKNLRNNRSVIVRINDRGPFAGNRLIDLSKAAAEELGMIHSGVVEVELRVLN
jgi:rare lipoprotein A